MRTLLILLPPLGLALLPLGLAAVRYRSRAHNKVLTRRDRVLLAAGSLLRGVIPAAVLLLVIALWPGWCRVAPRGGLADADSFVALGFGMGPGRTPGASNRALAEWLAGNNPAGKPVVVQEGVYLALGELEADRPGRLRGWRIIRLPDREGVYVDTSGAAFQADAVLDREQLRRPVLVAHDLQLQRAVWAFEDAGIGDAVAPDLPPTPFDPDSVQHLGTRYLPVWLAREALAARPLTLCPQATCAAVAAVAALYAWAACRVRSGADPMRLTSSAYPPPAAERPPS